MRWSLTTLSERVFLCAALVAAALCTAAVPCTAVAAEAWNDGCELAGRAIDADGNPLPDVEVVAMSFTTADAPTTAIRSWRSRTDEHGAFAFGGLPCGNLYLVFRKEGLIIDVDGTRPFMQKARFTHPGQQMTGLEVGMLPTELAHGLVVDEAGTPVAGATVDCIWYAATTDADGVFEMPAEMAARASAWAPGYETTISYSIQWRDGQPLFVLRQGLDVTGRVLDASNRPVAGAEIVYSEAGIAGPRNAVRATSESDGAFVLHDVRRGSTPLYATHGDRIGTTTARVIDEDIDGVEIRLQKGATISGRLIDNVTGQPLAGVPVSACSESRFAVQVKTDDEGRYVLSGLREGQIGVVPGSRVLRAEHAPLARHFYLGPGCNVPNVDFTLDNPYAQTSQRLTGTIVDEAGQPVPYAAVLAFRQEGDGAKTRPDWYGISDITGAITPRSASPDSQGLTPGRTYTVVVLHDAHAAEQIDDVLIPNDPETKELEIVLERGMTARGTVLDDAGKPLAGALVSAVKSQPAQPRDDGPVVRRRNDQALRARSLPDGTYDLHGLTPGTWRISATHRECTGDGEPVVVEIEAGIEPPESDLTLERLKLDVLAGRIVDADGAPVPHTIVQAQTQRPVSVYRWAYSDDDGRFQFDGIPEGTYRLVVTHMTRGNCFLNGAATGTPDLVLKLVPTRRIEPPRWKLVDEGGKPITEFRYDSGQSARRWVECHTDTGEFTASLQRGTLVLEADGYASKTITLDAPPEDGSPITVKMTKGQGALSERIMADGTRQVTKSSIVRRAQGPRTGAEPPLAPEPHRWVCEGGPYGGSVRAVAIAASDPNVLYACARGGAYKSVDAAASWQRVSALKPGRAWSWPSDVEVDPRDADTVYAVDNSLFKSTDGGETWLDVWPWHTDRPLGSVEIDAGNPDTLYVWETGRGVCKSTDGGKTWQEANSGLHGRTRGTICADQHWPGMLYATTRERASLYESNDGGATWRRLGGSVEDVTIKSFKLVRSRQETYQLTLVHEDKEYVYEAMDEGRYWRCLEGSSPLIPSYLTIDDDDPDHLHVSIVRHSGGGDIYLSTDAAATWRMISLPFENRELAGIALSRTDKDVLFAAAQDGEFYFSADAGDTWEFLYWAEDDPDGTDTDTIDALRACRLYGVLDWRYRFSSCAFHPTDLDVAYAIPHRHGVVRTDDGGTTWTPVHNGIAATRIQRVVCDPATAGLVYAHGWFGTQRSTDGGRTWKQIRHPYGTMAIFAVHPHDPDVLLTAWHGRSLQISRDAGDTWIESDTITQCDAPISFVFDPDDAKHFCLLDRAGLHETTDGGRTWQEPRTDVLLPKISSGDSTSRITQHSMRTMYLLDSRRRPWRSTDGGKTWSEALPPDTGEWSELLYVHPSDPNVVFVVIRSSELLVSRDGGETWTAHEVSGAYSGITCMTTDPTDPDTFYIATQSSRNGILRTRDGGKTFDRLANGLPPQVQSLAVSPVDGTLYAGTGGQGVYRLEIKDPGDDNAREE